MRPPRRPRPSRSGRRSAARPASPPPGRASPRRSRRRSSTAARRAGSRATARRSRRSRPARSRRPSPGSRPASRPCPTSRCCAATWPRRSCARPCATTRRSYPCAQCPELLARALELAPERVEIAELSRRWLAEAEAEQGFWRESSLHFDLSYDGSRDDLLWSSPRLLELLEEAYTDYAELFGHHPAERGAPRIAVSLYPRASFGRLTGLGDWAGGAFDGTVRVPIGDFELDEAALRRVLRHELVHAFVHAVGGASVPGWLNEGLAQWLEEGRAEQLAAARESLAGAALFPLERLEGSLASWSDAREIGLAYAQSLLLVEHLEQHYGERVLFALVEGCGKGETLAGTFRSLTGVELALVLSDLEAELAGR